MKNIKDELQHIILGDDSNGSGGKLKQTQTFLRGHAQANVDAKELQLFKSEETKAILAFAKDRDLFYYDKIDNKNFISEGAEQKVYRLNDSQIIKTNAGSIILIVYLFITISFLLQPTLF